MTLPSELRALIESGPLTHLSTINADGSPQVSVIWLGLDGEDLVTAHMRRNQLKLRNIDRDPRVVLSFLAPPEPGVFLAHHALIKATATIEGPTRGRVGAAGPAGEAVRRAGHHVPGAARRRVDRAVRRREDRRRRALGQLTVSVNASGFGR